MGTWKGAPGWLAGSCRPSRGAHPCRLHPLQPCCQQAHPGSSAAASTSMLTSSRCSALCSSRLSSRWPSAAGAHRRGSRRQAVSGGRQAPPDVGHQEQGALTCSPAAPACRLPPRDRGCSQPAAPWVAARRLPLGSQQGCPLGRSKAAPWVAARRAARWNPAGAHRAAGPAGSAACPPSRPPAAQPSSGGTPRPAAARPAQEWQEGIACPPGVRSSWARKRRAVGPSRIAGAGRQQQLGRARRTRAPRRAASSRAACSARCAASLVTSQLRSE